MATPNPHENEESDYVSDPEDAPLPSMRRRDASDDEDGDVSADESRKVVREVSDEDSDRQGAAEVYDEDYEELDEEEEYYDDDEEVVGGVSENVNKRPSGVEKVSEGLVENFAEEEEEKEVEAVAVPTSGKFYMHDDRFQESGRGRGRRRHMFSSQNLWDNKDEHAWLHDRFEEMNVQDSRYNEEKRNSKGRFRGRGGPGRGGRGRGYASGHPRSYNDDADNQNRAPRVFRGRGPRRYDSHFKNYRENKSMQQKRLPVKSSQETTRNSGADKPSSQSTGFQQDRFLPQKNSISSSLNYASPPFYPSSSSGQDVPIQKHDVQGRIDNKGLPHSMQLKTSLETSNSSSLLRATAVIDATGQGNVIQPHSFRSPGRGSNTSAAPSTQSNTAHNQVGRVSAQLHSSVIHQKPVLPPTLPTVRVSTKQSAQRPGSGNQASHPHPHPHPPQHPSGSSEVGESDSPPGSSQSKTSSVAKGKVNSQGTGSGSFLYGGAQVIGAAGTMGLPHGDQNFPGTPALLPVMQFGGQHPSGLGVPAMGMALPGYVAQPQLGFGNSEMTWMPVLAGAAGALGGQYCPPYIALDSSYFANPGQTQSSVSSRETGTSKSDGSLKSNQLPEIVNEEIGQRQNKPRRYSAMSFGQ